MKKLTQIALIVLITVSTQIANAMLYSINNADLLLLFRSDSYGKNVEVDIGPVTNLLNLASGATTNFSYVYIPNQVKTNFGSSYSTVVFNVVGVNVFNVSRPNTAWMTDFSDTNAPANFNSSDYSTIRSLIQSVGAKATSSTGGGNFPSSNYVAATTATTAYDYIVAIGPLGSTTYMYNFGGNLPFTDEALAGNTQNFYQFNDSGTGSATLVGTFSMDATSGAVTFTRASGTVVVTLVPSQIVNVARSTGSTQVSFTTTNGNNYQLLYKTNLTQAGWTTNAAAGVVAGDNTVKVLNDTTTDAQRFYRIQSF